MKDVSRYPPVADPTKFVEDLTRVLRRAKPSPEVTRELLEEAQQLFKFPLERGDTSDRRATALQGAVAIAATFTLAAGSLVAGTDKVGSHAWRIIFAAAFAFVVAFFVLAGVIALQATSRIKRWRYPDEQVRFVRRAQMDVRGAQIERIAELLNAYGLNDALAAWKVERTTRAAQCFRVALASLVILALLFVLYVIAADAPAATGI